MKRLIVIGVLALLLPVVACTTPGATEIPVESQPADSDPASRPDTANAAEPIASQPAAMPANPGAANGKTDGPPEIPVAIESQEYNGVNGGKAVFELDGTPEDVLAKLLDFEHADGHRAWAKAHTNVRRSGDETIAHWQFNGKAGVNPDCDIVFTTIRRKSDIVLRFKQKEPVFGLAAFFGDYRLQAAGAARTKVTARVFIASGILIADASLEEIADGLREDAKLLADWKR